MCNCANHVFLAGDTIPWTFCRLSIGLVRVSTEAHHSCRIDELSEDFVTMPSTSESKGPKVMRKVVRRLGPVKFCSDEEIMPFRVSSGLPKDRCHLGAQLFEGYHYLWLNAHNPKRWLRLSEQRIECVQIVTLCDLCVELHSSRLPMASHRDATTVTVILKTARRDVDKWSHKGYLMSRSALRRRRDGVG